MVWSYRLHWSGPTGFNGLALQAVMVWPYRLYWSGLEAVKVWPYRLY